GIAPVLTGSNVAQCQAWKYEQVAVGEHAPELGAQVANPPLLRQVVGSSTFFHGALFLQCLATAVLRQFSPPLKLLHILLEALAKRLLEIGANLPDFEAVPFLLSLGDFCSGQQENNAASDREPILLVDLGERFLKVFILRGRGAEQFAETGDA